jgi:ubiquinone/menaquinone biosynthesis C-methylase UbiE
VRRKGKEVTSVLAGLKDLRKSGWCNASEKEMMPGVPVFPGMKVVDVGCGDGGYSRFCAENGADVTAVDAQEEKVRGLEASLADGAQGTLKGIVSECNPIPLPDGYADLVICTEVLEHVKSPPEFVEELSRITKPEGRLLLTVPDERSEKLIQGVAPDGYFTEPNHIRIFTPDKFTRLVTDSGLQIEQQTSIGAFWSIFFLFKWATVEPGEGLVEDAHPLTKAWAQTWWEILGHPNAEQMVNALNDALPKSQVILARKSNADLG